MFKRIRDWFSSWFKTTPAKARRLWAKALRSGEYEQGCGALYDGSRHCCLGVACEVYDKHVGGLDRTQHPHDKVPTYNFNSCTLPRCVARWLDITPSGVLKTQVDVYGNLIACNDVGGLTFDSIADIIDAGNLQTLDSWENS